jgi:hypothetical protein
MDVIAPDGRLVDMLRDEELVSTDQVQSEGIIHLPNGRISNGSSHRSSLTTNIYFLDALRGSGRVSPADL